MQGRRKTRQPLAFEILEERLVLSTAATAWEDYAAWRQSAIGITGKAAVVDAPLDAPEAQLAQSLRLIGLEQARARYPFTGAGYTVAIIDTGVDYNHPALGDGWGHRVIGGWDFVDDDPDPMDLHGHGTHVAGIVASSHATYSGVVPEANLVALRVLDAQGSGTFGDVEDALRWVAAYASHYNIVAVTLSLGAGNFSDNPYGFLEDELGALANRGVFVAAASGNSFFTEQSVPGLAYPAISTQTVSVGAVWDGDYGAIQWSSGAVDYSTEASRLASFSQRSDRLSILAPGAFITSTYLNGRFASMAGTSMATPVVAGAAVLLHQAFDATARGHYGYREALIGLMRDTGFVVIDGDDEDDNVINTGATFRQLDVLAALEAIGPPPALYADRADPVIVRNAVWQFDLANNGHWPEQTLGYGLRTDTFVAGDVNGDGRDEIGVFRNGIWQWDLAGDGHWPERLVAFGLPGDRTVVGDFNGDGRDDLGIFRNGSWQLDLAGDGHLPERIIAFGLPTDIPIVGDFNGDGRDDLGIFRNGSWQIDVAGDGHLPEWTFQFGGAGDLPVVGDWDGDGRDDPGIFRNGVWYLAPGNGAVLMFRYGQTGDIPLTFQRFTGAAASTGTLASSSSLTGPAARNGLTLAVRPTSLPSAAGSPSPETIRDDAQRSTHDNGDSRKDPAGDQVRSTLATRAETADRQDATAPEPAASPERSRLAANRHRAAAVDHLLETTTDFDLYGLTTIG